ncbi:unnamed protein product [Urochloa decumbens]|uniref:NB-ARC domain-containing protein n=1 Tax=Urochloa decumbens TaxID=240449 RepID=A0ABC9DAN7_9POAL
MESFLSAVLGELMTRSINFIINKCFNPPVIAVEDSLQRALLRAEVIIEEAMGIHITNQAMRQLLGMLIDAMHRGYYTLDTFRYEPQYAEDAKDQAVSHFVFLSKLNSATGPYFSRTSARNMGPLREALGRLTSVIVDVDELVVFLMSYPRLHRQPYSMHILLGNCMFGRQMEVEHVINFLLHKQPHGSEGLEVLPIIGPARIGKSTLVAHVCKDERIRDHFSKLLFLHDHEFTDDKLAFREGCGMKDQNSVSKSNMGKGLLVVLELAGDLNEDAWNKLYHACKQCVPSGCKIIITSRSDKVVKLGTTQPLTLKYLSHEAYWYFFKTLTFGSIDPETHPRLTQLAMEIARMQSGSLNGAYITSSLLRDNFDIHFWCKVLSFLRGFVQNYLSKFGENPFDLLNQNRPVQLGRMAVPSEVFMICHQYQRSSQEEVPEIRIQDVIYGCVKTRGKFEALVWRSQIPPYYSYVHTCEIRELKTTGAKRKRSMKGGNKS